MMCADECTLWEQNARVVQHWAWYGKIFIFDSGEGKTSGR